MPRQNTDWKPPTIQPTTRLDDVLSSGGRLGLDSNASLAQGREIGAEVVATCHKFSAAFQSLGINVRFDPTTLEQRIKHPDSDWLQHCRPVVQKKFKGTMPDESIWTIALACAVYLQQYVEGEDGERHIVLWGATQLGKTLVFAGLFLILPILERLLYGRRAIPIINVPDKKNLSASSLKETELVMRLYGDISIHSLSQEQGLQLTHVQDIIDDVCRKYPGENRSTAPGLYSLVLQRNPSNEADYRYLASIKEKCPDDYTVIDFTDEIHWGSASKSIMASWQASLEGYRSRRIGISATPSETWGSYQWVVVPMFVPPTYQGITSYNGIQLPTLDGHIVPIQRIESVEEHFPKLNLDVCLARGKQYLHPSQWYEANSEHSDELWGCMSEEEREGITRRHKLMQRRWAKQIFSIFHELATDDYPIVFLRPFSTIAPCQLLYDYIENWQDDEHQVLKYFGSPLSPVFGEGHTQKTLKEVLIDEYVLRHRKCLVLASSGRSRMGDSYPPQCATYIDLAQGVQSDWNTILQGTVGRSQGNFKNSTCYLRQEVASKLKHFIDNGCYDDSSMSQRDSRGDERRDANKRRGRRAKQRVLEFVGRYRKPKLEI